MRASTLAVIMLLANLVGMGAGPQLVGFLSDLWRPTLGSDSLRYAMIAMSYTAVWAAVHLWQVGKTIHQELETPATCRQSAPAARVP
jgi:hypothetical protein